MKTVFGLIAFALALCVGIRTEAATTIMTYDSGWYARYGGHDIDNRNIIVGGEGVEVYRNFFAFNLAALALSGQQVRDATLSILPAGGYESGDAFETIGFFDFSGNVTFLTGGAGGVAAYNDLGSGNLYGQVTVRGERPWYGPMGEINVALTLAAIADLNRILAGDDPRFVIGGALLTASNAGIYPESVWSGSGGGSGPFGARLIINAETPLPGALGLFASALGLGGIGRWFRKRRKPPAEKPRGGTTDPISWRIMQDDVALYMERQAAEASRPDGLARTGTR